MSIKKAEMITFVQNGNESGKISIIEGNQAIPFEIKRVFYIYNTSSEGVRGKHSNRKTEFVLIAVSGSCKVLAKDGMGYEEIFNLDNPNQGVYLPKLIWKEMYDFSEDCVLLALASEHYDAQEYIRSIEELQQEIQYERTT